MSKIDIIKALMITIDMLDRIEGTSIYNIQKKHYGYTDAEYQQAIKHLTGMYEYLKDRNDN